MLDRASLHALARHPEQNDPILNVALAEEGDFVVLLALAECAAIGPAAISRIGGRIEAEGENVGRSEDSEVEDPPRRGSRHTEDEPGHDNGLELDKRLIVHPNADDGVRDGILARHAGDPFFALAAASHRHATAHAIERLVQWPALTPLA